MESRPGWYGKLIGARCEVDVDGRIGRGTVGQDVAQAVTVDIELRRPDRTASKTSPVIAVIRLLLISFAAWAETRNLTR